MAELLVAGYFGFGNFGDDLILQSFLESFPKAGEKIHLLTSRRYQTLPSSVNQISRYDLAAILRLFMIKKNLKLVFPGGEILQTRTSRRSLAYYSFLIKLARFFKRKYYLLFQGFYPETMDMRTARYCTNLFRGADFACIRDHDKAWIESHVGGKVGACADITLQYDIKCTRRPVVPNSFLFVLRQASREEMKTALAVVQELADKFPDYMIRFFPAHPEKDLPFIHQVIRKLKTTRSFAEAERFHIAPWKNIAEAIGHISSAGFVFSMRYHPALVTFRLGRPCVVLANDPRMEIFREQD